MDNNAHYRSESAYTKLSEIPVRFSENEIAIDTVTLDQNYRKTMAEDAINDLAASIETFGLLSPIIVIEQPDGRYLLCAGGRRIAALQKLGKDTLPKATIYPADALPFHKAMMYADNFEREDVALREVLDGIEEAFNEAYDGMQKTDEAVDIKNRLDDAIKDMGQFAGIPRRLFSVYSKLSQAYLLKNKHGAYALPTFRKIITDDATSDLNTLYDIAIALLEAMGTKRAKSVNSKLKEMVRGSVKDSLRNNANKLKKFAQGKTAKSGILPKANATNEPKENKSTEPVTPVGNQSPSLGIISAQKIDSLDRALLRFERYIDSLNEQDSALSDDDIALLEKLNEKLSKTPLKIAQLLQTEQ